MIVETNGLPGSGKTYFCHSLYENVKLEYKDIYNMNCIEKDILNKIIQKIIGNIEFYCNYKNQMYRILEKKYRANSATYAKSIKVKDYLKRLVYLKWFYKKNKSKKIIYIFDEGIYQVITAMASDFKLEEYEIENIIKDIVNDEKIICVFIKIHLSDVLNSIKKRNRNICDIDVLDKEDLYNMLKRYDLLLSSMMESNTENIILDRNNDINKNIEIIRNKIGV